MKFYILFFVFLTEVVFADDLFPEYLEDDLYRDIYLIESPTEYRRELDLFDDQEGVEPIYVPFAPYTFDSIGIPSVNLIDNDTLRLLTEPGFDHE